MKIKSIIDIDDCNSAIKWRLTDACNYRCSYCIRKVYGRLESQDVEMLKEDLKIIFDVAPEINRIIEELPGTVKLDLIGGEVSLIDLKELLKKLTSPKLKRVNITTNLSMNESYYLDLIEYLYQRGIILGLTASCHLEYTTVEKFINKIHSIKIKSKDRCYIKTEFVSMETNQEECKKFMEECELKQITYLIDRDMRCDDSIRSNLISATSAKKNIRYKILFEDGTEKTYQSRNAFITGNLNTIHNRAFNSSGYYCTRDVNYVYIEKDKHRGKGPDTIDTWQRPVYDENNCRNFCYVSEFHVLQKPSKCSKKGCTLCGHFSLALEKKDLTK